MMIASRASIARPWNRPVLAGFAAALMAAGCTTASPEQQAAADLRDVHRQEVHLQQMCAACHGPGGQSVSVRAPILGGQNADYLAAQLHAFRDHSRADPDGRTFMWPMAAGLSDAAIADLAARFAATPAVHPASPATDTASGQATYQAGVPAKGVPACSSCHGDKAQGVAVFPRLAGQHADYVQAQLAAYADGSRPNPVMGPIAKQLAPEDAERIAAYIATLD